MRIHFTRYSPFNMSFKMIDQIGQLYSFKVEEFLPLESGLYLETVIFCSMAVK